MNTTNQHARIEVMTECGETGIRIVAYCIKCNKRVTRVCGRHGKKTLPGIARTMAVRDLRRRVCNPPRGQHPLIPAGEFYDTPTMRESVEAEFEAKYGEIW